MQIQVQIVDTNSCFLWELLETEAKCVFTHIARMILAPCARDALRRETDQ